MLQGGDQGAEKAAGGALDQAVQPGLFDLYAMRFFPDYQNGSAFLERTLERAQPSLGYYPLPALLPTRATTW